MRKQIEIEIVGDFLGKNEKRNYSTNDIHSVCLKNCKVCNLSPCVLPKKTRWNKNK